MPETSTFITKLPSASENVSFSGDLLESRCASIATEPAVAIELGLQPKQDEEAIHMHSRPSSSNEVLEFDDEQQRTDSVHQPLLAESKLPSDPGLYINN